MHVHTTFSPDGISTMEECCENALKKRLAKICFTDHVDWNSAEKNLNKVYDNRKNNFNIKAYFNKIAECRVAYPSLEILTGIEFSEPSLFPEEFLSYSKLPFDYILGSVHHCYNGIFSGAANIDEKRAIQEYYEIMMRSIENYEIQAMAHFDFPRIFFDKWKLDDKVLNNILKLMINKNDVGNLTCGFLELVAKDSVPVITDEMAEGGLICFADSQSFNSGFVVDRFITLHASSGIWNGYYFVNRQITNYAVQISIQTASVAEMDRQIDCINYDEGRTMWLAEVVPTMSFEASSLYTADETKAYNAAVEALQQITAIQNSNAYKSASYSLVIIETSLLESIALSEQKGTIGTEEFGYYDLEAINGIELEDNQIVMVTASSGVQILTIPTEEELKAAADSRAAMGLIQIIGNALLAVGGVAICIVTWGTATPLVAGICIAAGTVSTTYALSNIAEGISNVYYGLNGDITSSAVNPVKDLLADAIGDEQTANIVYHAVGISSSIIQSLILPFNAGLNFANGIGATAGQTVLIVGRVVGTEIVKMAVTAGVSYLASIGLSKLTVDITGSEAVGQLVGFAGALLAGFVTYKGLTAIDMKYNFSGLYAKVGLGKVYSNVNLREEALKHFNPAEWGKMSMTEKKTAIERLAHVVADELGLNNPPKIKYYYKKADSYGYYSDTNNSLNINTYYFTNGQTPWVEIVDTVAHEMRHAYQYARLLSGINDDITYSYKHYISSDVDPVGYFNQACEVDAYNYGSYWAKLLKEVIL